MRKFLSLLAVLVLLSSLAFSQTKTVTGKVTDQSGQPVPFATVRVKGTKVGVSADADGNFSIKASPSQELVVTGNGITETAVPVGDASDVSVKVKRTSSILSEVVVTSLGITRQSKELGYAAVKVTNKELTQAQPISVANGLTGKVSGLQVNTTNNGLFAPTRMTLRGNRSLTGNNEPLIVVDGAIYYSDISTLNPQDVAEMTVLKGSSASAIYGSDASNGVIVVTTKHGTRNSKPVLQFTSSYSMEKVSYMPSYQERFGSDGGEVPYILDFNDLSAYVPYENQSYGPEYNGKMVPLGRPQPDGTLFVPYSAVKNQKRDFFQTGSTWANTLSFSSGDENGNFFMSAQDLTSTAVMPGDEGRRDIFRLGGAKKYGIFSASFALSYAYKTTDTTNTFDVYQNMIESPTLAPLNSMKNWQTGAYSTPSSYYNDYYPSPWVTIGNYRNVNEESNIAGNLLLSLRPLKWLQFSYRVALNNISHRYEAKNNEIVYTQWALNNPDVIYSNPNGTAYDTVTESAKYNATQDNPHPATYGTYQLNNFLLASDFLAQVNLPFANDWKFTGTAGTAYLDNQIDYTPIGQSVSGPTPLVFPVFNNGNAAQATSTQGQYSFHARKLGIFGEGGFGYKNFAFIHGSFREDIDSRLSEENRWIPYWDIDGTLIISDLFPAIAEGKILNYAKIRFAHSITGNVSALAGGSPYIAYGAYATTPTLYSAPGFPYAASGLSGYNLNPVVANPNIKPETVTENEFGMDLGFFKDRLNVGLSVYSAKTTDGIVYAQVSRGSGNIQALINAATTTNKGVELDVRANIIRTTDWRWDVGVNWTHNVSNVESINGNVPAIALGAENSNAFAQVGYAYPVIKTYDWVRDSASGKVIVDGVSGTPTKSSQLSIMGNANPTDIVGITTALSYKNFTLNVTADYRTGYYVFNSIANTMDHSGVGSTTAVSGRQSFVFPNSVIEDPGNKGHYIDNTSTTVVDGNYFWPNVYRTVGANYVTSAAAWKLREVVISYSFPQNWLSPTKVVKNATLSISGRNLIMIRPSTNLWTDPEFSEGSGNGVGRNSEGQAPPTRFYTATLALTF
jgi:TonB-linked SusC/RagA family outer membrane protein